MKSIPDPAAMTGGEAARPGGTRPPLASAIVAGPPPREAEWNLPGADEVVMVFGPSLEEPPTLPCPELGQEVSVPDPENTCPHCGSSRAHWVYNPRSHRGQRGWVLQRRLVCCPAADRLAPLELPPPPAGYTLSQAELDREFVQYSVRAQTFLTFDLSIQPRLAPVFRAVERYAHVFQPDQTRHGIFIAGIAGIGKSHLVHCLVNQARALRLPALSLTLTQLLDLTVPERGETAEEREERNDRRRILRQVPVLAIRDLGRHDLSAAEIKELSLLLEYREDRGLVTHGTGTETPAKYRDRPVWGQTRDAIAALTHRLERLCDPILTCDPRISASPARMRRPAARRSGALEEGGQGARPAPSTRLPAPGTRSTNGWLPAGHQGNGAPINGAPVPRVSRHPRD